MMQLLAKHRLRIDLLIVLLAVASSSCGGDEDVPLIETQAQAITDGRLDALDRYPNVGLVLPGTASCTIGAGMNHCTGTLVGERAVVTAAHCIEPGQPHVFCLSGSGGLIPGLEAPTDGYVVRQATRHPDYDPKVMVKNDIGVLILSRAVEQPVAPISDREPLVNERVTMVGYGRTSLAEPSDGMRRIASNVIAKVDSLSITVDGTGNGSGNTCKGDSGGPALVNDGEREIIAGVVSAGPEDDCSRSVFVRVDRHRNWIREMIDSDGAAAGVDPEAGQEDVACGIGGCPQTRSGSGVGAFGTRCSDDSDCASGYCVNAGVGVMPRCSDPTAMEGFAGCRISTGTPDAPTSGLLPILVLVPVVVVRRRRRNPF